MWKSLLILLALGVGLLLPALDAYTFVLRPFLMILLFFSFLGVRLGPDIFSRWQVVAGALLLFTGPAVYYLGAWHSTDLGLTLLLMGLAPTAVITPVLAQIMGKDVGYMVGAILVSTAVFALAVPVLLPYFLGRSLSWSALFDLLFTIGVTIAGPLVLGQLVKAVGGRLLSTLRGVSPYAFVLFLINIAVAAGSLSHYLRGAQGVPWSFVWWTLGSIATLVVVNFSVGSWLAPRGYGVEGSLNLGRKNTMLSIWIALEYINPLVVLGPMLYILLQNVLVAGQIVWVERRGRRA